MQEIPGDPRQCTVATQAVEHPEMSSQFWTIRVSCPCGEGWVSPSGRSAQHTSWGPTNVTVAVQTCQPGPGLWLLLESGHSSRSFVLQWSPQVTNKETRREGRISERHMVLSVAIPTYPKNPGWPRTILLFLNKVPRERPWEDRDVLIGFIENGRRLQKVWVAVKRSLSP